MIIAVLSVLWLFALRPLSVGDILLVTVVALVVGWILELLQRRPEEFVVIGAPVRVVRTVGSAVSRPRMVT